MSADKRNRTEFVFTIGYDGARAVLDGQALKRYGSLSTRELAEKGLFRAAWASALYSGDEAERRAVLEIYSRNAPGGAPDIASLDRLFGVSLKASDTGAGTGNTKSGKTRRPLIL